MERYSLKILKKPIGSIHKQGPYFQGGAIQANINIRVKNRFDASLQINQTYKISGYGFQLAKTWMQVLPHTLSLVFGNQTDIQSIPDKGFPNHYFRFAQYKDLFSKVDVKEWLNIPIPYVGRQSSKLHLLFTDYVGCVTYVTGVQEVVKPTNEVLQWRDIGIQNLE